MITPPRPDPALVNKLVVANRILYDQGVVDGFSHRKPALPIRSLGQVKPSCR